MTKDKKIVFGLICLGCITISFNVAAITAVIPVISQDLRLSNIITAKMIPYYMIPYGLGALLYAPLTKYFSYRRIISASMIFFSLACLLCAKAVNINQILIARIVMGIAGASAIPLGLIILGEFFEKTIRGRLVGIFFGCSFFASLAGLALSGLADWRWLFFVPSVLGIVLSVFCYLAPIDILRKIHGVDVHYSNIITNLKIRNIFIYISVISALYHGVHKWFGIFLSEIYQLNKLQISTLFIFGAIAGFTGQILGGILSDKKGRRFASYIGILGLALMTGILSLKFSFVLSCISIIFISMFWTIGHNGISTALTDFPDKDRPVIASLNSSLRFLAGGIGFYFSSYFVGNSFSATFFVISLLMFMLSFTLKKVIDDN